MRKIASVVCVLAILLTLCGCGSTKPGKADAEELKQILTSIAEDDDLSKLDAVKYGGELAMWVKNTELSPGECARTAQEWLSERSPEIQAAVMEKVSKVADTVQTQGDKLLQGVEDGSIPKKVMDILTEIAASGGVEKK